MLRSPCSYLSLLSLSAFISLGYGNSAQAQIIFKPPITEILSTSESAPLQQQQTAENPSTDRPNATPSPTNESPEIDRPNPTPPTTDTPPANSDRSPPPAPKAGSAVPPGGFLLNPAQVNGERISSIQVDLENPTDNPERNQQLQQQIGEAFALRSGDSFNRLFANAGLQRVEQLPFVQTVQYVLYEVQIPGEVVVIVSVKLKTETVTLPRKTGIFVTGNFREFPNLYTSDRATAVAVLHGGLSNFTSSNTWFGKSALFTQGNPLARDPAGLGTYSWIDSYLEFGLAGITQVGTIPLYVYGSFTNLVSTTLQPDLFQSDNRIFNQIEDLYGGFIYSYRTNSSRFGVNLSVGRQDYRISNGLLFANGAGNGGDRATILSNPRTAFSNTAIGRVRLNNFRLEGFYLNPDELPIIDSKTEFVGANLEYNDNRSLQFGLSYIHVPTSNSSYFTSTDVFPREGLNVIYPRLRLTNPFGLKGLWFQAEYAHEWNNNFDMNANAAWAQIGYTFRNLPWTPTLSYRYAYFSGDYPKTSAFERFDPLLSGGSPDTWIQGANLVKIYQNSNLITHQVLLRFRPTQRFDLSLQYIHLSAVELNNLGGAQVLSFLESSEIGQEITLTSRYNLSRNFLLYASGSVAFPGAAIQRVVGDNPSPWYFLQLSFLINF